MGALALGKRFERFHLELADTFPGQPQDLPDLVERLFGGADKADTLAQVAKGPSELYPSSLVTAADLVWMIDRAAGAKLS